MDNIFARLNIFSQRETQSPSANTTQEAQQPVKAGNWEANVVTPRGMRSLLVPTWYRCVTLIMQTMGQMRVQYRRLNREGGNYFEDRYGYARQLNYLLQLRPNPMMTASQMQKQIEFRKIYYGNAYVYIERDGLGDVHALWLCTGGSFLPTTNRYNLQYNGEYGPVMLNGVPAEDVLHFKNTILDYGMMYGLPTIQFAMKALQIAATGDDQALQDMAKGGKYKVLIQEEKAQKVGTIGRANRQELRKMTDEFANDWMKNDVVLLDNVTDAKILSQTAQQLQLLEQRGYSDEALCRLLGVPKVMAMIGDGGSYKMPEHATQEFLLRTIQPIIREEEDELNTKLLTFEDFGKREIHICEKALRRLDAKGQAEIDKMHLEAGWSVNELRSQHDLPAIPEGDCHYVSTNLAEVGSEKLRGSSGGDTKPQPAPATNNNDGEGAVEGDDA